MSDRTDPTEWLKQHSGKEVFVNHFTWTLNFEYRGFLREESVGGRSNWLVVPDERYGPLRKIALNLSLAVKLETLVGPNNKEYVVIIYKDNERVSIVPEDPINASRAAVE